MKIEIETTVEGHLPNRLLNPFPFYNNYYGIVERVRRVFCEVIHCPEDQKSERCLPPGVILPHLLQHPGNHTAPPRLLPYASGALPL